MDLNYKIFGEGEPVVILHGLFGMLDNWQTFAKQLADHHMVYIVDQRDHGRSPHTEDFTYKLLADDLAHFCEQHWLYEARFIGHSMGGKTLLQFAKEHEDIIEQMVIVDMGIRQYPGGHESIIAALNRLDLDTIENRGAAEEQLADSIKEYGIRQFLLKNLTRRKSGGYNWKMNLDLLTTHYPQILSAIEFDHVVEVPTLFARGAKSRYIADDDIPGLLDHFPNGRVVTLADAGHWVHAEQPAALLAEVLSFFDSRG